MCCGTLTNVEIKDDGSYTSWTSFSDNGDGYYSFDNNGNAFSTPLDVRLTNSLGEQLEIYDNCGKDFEIIFS